MLVRRAAIERAGLFDETERVGDWIEWYMRLRDSGARETMVEDALVHRRLHGDNNSLRVEGSRSEYLRAVKAHLDRQRGRS
jgi:hypothetical protein